MTRPMTMAEKILAAHAGLSEVVPGQLVECDLDLVLANDITAPIAIKTVNEIGAGVFDRDRICRRAARVPRVVPSWVSRIAVRDSSSVVMHFAMATAVA